LGGSFINASGALRGEIVKLRLLSLRANGSRECAPRWLAMTLNDLLLFEN
jgi:hypothetical protein